MIVIATNNGIKFLPKLLNSIDLHGSNGHKICIVDTGSTDEFSLNYINELDKDKYIITKTEYKGYDTGAYIHAYLRFPDDEYIFLHDSMEVLTDDWIQDFKNPHTDVCYYSTFNIAFDIPEQISKLTELGIYNENTVNCVFGPIFYIKRSALDIIHNKVDLTKVIPTCKMDQQGMERGWSMMIDSANISKSWLSYFAWNGDPTVVYKNMCKYRPIRT